MKIEIEIKDKELEVVKKNFQIQSEMLKNKRNKSNQETKNIININNNKSINSSDDTNENQIKIGDDFDSAAEINLYDNIADKNINYNKINIEPNLIPSGSLLIPFSESNINQYNSNEMSLIRVLQENNIEYKEKNSKLLLDINEIKEYYEETLMKKYIKYLEILEENESVLNENKNILEVLSELVGMINDYSKKLNNNLNSNEKNKSDSDNLNNFNNLNNNDLSKTTLELSNLVSNYYSEISKLNNNYINFKSIFEQNRIINPSPSKNIFWLEEQLQKTREKVDSVNDMINNSLNQSVYIVEQKKDTNKEIVEGNSHNDKDDKYNKNDNDVNDAIKKLKQRVRLSNKNNISINSTNNNNMNSESFYVNVSFNNKIFDSKVNDSNNNYKYISTFSNNFMNYNNNNSSTYLYENINDNIIDIKDHSKDSNRNVIENQNSNINSISNIKNSANVYYKKSNNIGLSKNKLYLNRKNNSNIPKSPIKNRDSEIENNYRNDDLLINNVLNDGKINDQKKNDMISNISIYVNVNNNSSQENNNFNKDSLVNELSNSINSVTRSKNDIKEINTSSNINTNNYCYNNINNYAENNNTPYIKKSCISSSREKSVGSIKYSNKFFNYNENQELNEETKQANTINIKEKNSKNNNDNDNNNNINVCNKTHISFPSNMLKIINDYDSTLNIKNKNNNNNKIFNIPGNVIINKYEMEKQELLLKKENQLQKLFNKNQANNSNLNNNNSTKKKFPNASHSVVFKASNSGSNIISNLRVKNTAISNRNKAIYINNNNMSITGLLKNKIYGLRESNSNEKNRCHYNNV